MLNPEMTPHKSTMSNQYDLVVVGAGSGGIGAAIAASRLGLEVLLIEKNELIGGNASHGGVSIWEMGVGGTGIPYDIYEYLKDIEGAVGIYSFARHCSWLDNRGNSEFPPGADIRIDPSKKYIDTLRRHGARSLKEDKDFVKKYWHGVVFEPQIYSNTVEKILQDYGCKILKNTQVVGVEKNSNRISHLFLKTGDTVSARYFIDSTDSGFICKLFGAKMMFGRESKEVFGEPNAPDIPVNEINGVSLIYRITPTEEAGIENLSYNLPNNCWWDKDFPLASIVQYPNGDFNINMLPAMSGVDYMKLSHKDAYLECKKRALAHWHYLQTNYQEFRSYRISNFALSPGVRETYRVTGEYILTEHDLTSGLSRQSHDDIITIADHSMDPHGVEDSFCKEIREPYGVPFRCLIPKNSENLLIASRAASFSNIAASSCRLSRTMMQLGQAAGVATVLAANSPQNMPYIKLGAGELQNELRKQYVELDWPRSKELKDHLTD